MRARCRQRGIALAEFAIVSGLLFLNLFGIIEFSVILSDQAVITNASREGARIGIIQGRDDAEIENKVRTYVDRDLGGTRLFSLGGGGGPDAVDIQIARVGVCPTVPPLPQVRVTVTYPYRFMVLPGFMAGLANPFNLQAVTVMCAEP